MKKNVIILAAGKSSKFAPFTYERHMGLFRVKGGILIERQIEQILEAGISEIYNDSNPVMSCGGFVLTNYQNENVERKITFEERIGSILDNVGD